MRRSLTFVAAALLAAATAHAQYSRAPRSVLQSTAPATTTAPAAAPAPAAVPPTMPPTMQPAPVAVPPGIPAPAPAATSTPVPAAIPTPVPITPVTPAGGTLPGSAPPGGVPVVAPGTPIDRAAANSVALGTTTPPQFDRAIFDVDFGDVGSGEQVRRTIVLNTTTRGEVEFDTYVPNAPGFAIAEVRVMGTGASVGASSTTQAPLPGGGAGGPPTMAVRSVAQRVTAPPWRAQFDAAAELQVDVVYAPTLDLFGNTAGAKMGVLNGAIRNAGGAGTSASIALRANFLGLRQVDAAVLKPREGPVYVLPDWTGQARSFVAEFDVAPIATPIDGELRQAGDVAGIRIAPVRVRLAPGTSGIVRAAGTAAVAPAGPVEPDGVARTVPVELVWQTGSARSSIEIVPVPAAKSFNTGFLSNCGVSQTFVQFTYRFNDGRPGGGAQMELRNQDPLRTAYVFVEAKVGGERICWAHDDWPRSTPVGLPGESFSDGGCLASVDAYAKAIRGPIEFHCEALDCAGPDPETCARVAQSRRDHPELWQPRRK